MKCPKCNSDNPDTSRFCGSCAAALGLDGEVDFGPTKTLETPIQKIAEGTLVAGKYKIIEEIGRGGMGIVYKAEDTKLERTVALKFLPHQWTADAAARERFIHEARAASALDHPNVFTIYEIEETDDGRMYISMAFYEGESLKEKIKREPLKTEEAVAIAYQVVQGMAKAHQKGIVHRDLKPANILITTDGVAKIVDFGLAKLAGQVKLTREGTTVGTVAYMSPEQARGDAVDQRTDIWSLGVVFYEMLSGKLPFKGDYEQSLIHSILKTEPEPITKFRKDLPTGLAQIMAKALAKNPASRYQTMEELFEDLNAVAEGLKPLRAKAGLFRGKILGIKKIYAYFGLAVFIILAALALLFLFPKRDQIYDTLAVLPFENITKDSAPDFSTDELTAELIQKFCTIGSLQVSPSRRVKDFRDSRQSLQEIGRALNVKAILDANVRRSESKIRILATLFDSMTGRTLWTKSYDKDMNDVLFLLNAIVQDVIRETAIPLTPRDQKGTEAGRKVDPRAYDLYLLARKNMRFGIINLFRDNWRTIYRDLQQAAEIDPEFAPIYWSIIDFWANRRMDPGVTHEEAVAQAEAALKKGMSIDAVSAEAFKSAATLKLLNWDWDGARNDYRRASEASPGDPDLHVWYANSLCTLGFFDEALVEIRKAIRIDDSLNADGGLLGGFFIVCMRRYDDAIAVLEEGLKRVPDSSYAHNMLALAYALKGMKAEAVAEAERSIASPMTSESSMLQLNAIQVCAYVGRKNEALKRIQEYLASKREKPIDAYGVAGVYAVLDDKDQAFKSLAKAVQDHSTAIYQLRTDPFLDNLRSDPRFKAYLKKAGFEK